MESENSKRVAKPGQNALPSHGTQNLSRPLPPPRSTSMQTYHTFGSTPTSSLNPSSSRFHSSLMSNQIWNTPIPYVSRYPRRSLSNFPLATGPSVGPSALLASADNSQRTSAGTNMNFLSTFNKSSEPATGGSRENWRRSSILRTSRSQPMNGGSRENWRRPTILESSSLQPIDEENWRSSSVVRSRENWRRPSILRSRESWKRPLIRGSRENWRRPSILESRESWKRPSIRGSRENLKRPSILGTSREKLTRSSAKTSVLDHDVNDAGGSTKFSSKWLDFSSTMQQQPDMMLGNGRGARNVIGNRKYNVVRENKNTGADRTEANPTELNQNWGRNTNAFDIISRHEKEAIDERDEHKKGRPEKNSSKGRRIKIKLQDLPSTKDQQSGLIPKNGESTQHVTSTENSNVVHENSNTASDHFEANPTELKWNSSTDLNSSSTSPQLENEERDERELIKRTEKNIPFKRSSTMIEKERERLIDSVDNLHVENAVLKKQLLDLSEDYVKLKQENKAILEELIENFGQEKIVSLMIDEQLADLVESGNHN